jgi:hypothetical protein
MCVKHVHIYELLGDYAVAFMYPHLTYEVLNFSDTDLPNMPFLRNLILAMDVGLLYE